MKKITENLLIAIIGFSILFYGIKSILRTTIPTINKIEKYSMTKPNGQIDVNYLCPNDILVYSKSHYGVEDIGVFKIRRRSLIHYVGDLYNIDADGTPFGIRYYSGINDAWIVYQTFLFRSGTSSQSTYSNLIDFEDVFKFSDNSKYLQIDDFKYEKQTLSQEEINKITHLIKDVK